MFNDIRKIGKSTLIALYGLRFACADRSFRLEVQWGIPIFTAIGWYLWPLSSEELRSLVGAYALILIVELINTAFERMLERVHPGEHELIGKSKDIAAGAVGVACFFALFVIISLFVTHGISRAYVLGSWYV